MLVGQKTAWSWTVKSVHRACALEGESFRLEDGSNDGFGVVGDLEDCFYGHTHLQR